MLKCIGRYFALACLLFASGLAAAGERPFDQAAFDQLKAEGKPVVVYFHATWCPTCKIQQPIVDRLSASARLKDVTLFEADYDKEVALKRALHVTQQSTFVVFKNGHEVARSTGETTEPAIKNTLDKAL
ncbi:thioredoxin family protein [Trinickia violacea]|uniref:Thioredoxin family protein n=1 Tax=Trinickia violacea TaxID=2571746 RepID=A0A4V1EI36_9BURK|nr:thioredoxin family protein [Trinickia violacea]QCP52400.1 thioredoxin family protein [Trinickia violacea]